MSDRRTRTLARNDDPASRIALLRERLRSGDLSLERLRLAAYVGHEPAWVLLGVEASCHRRTSLYSRGGRVWYEGLQRWPLASLRAGVAAARVAIQSADWDTCCDGQDCTCLGMPTDGDWHRGLWTVKAAEAWIQDPTDEHYHAWECADAPDWAPWAGAERDAPECVEQIQMCVNMLPRVNNWGRRRVSDAIRDAIVPWALEDA